MPRRRKDGSVQSVMPLETWPEKARQAGYRAGCLGRSESANPYLVRTSMRDAWEDGRQAAIRNSSHALKAPDVR